MEAAVSRNYLRRKQTATLARQIEAHDRARREKQSAVDEATLTDAERAFCVLADSRGKRVFRHGWPDFLVVDKDTNGVVFVEVKTGADDVHESQLKMFAALEEVGLRVCVWRPEEPLILVPWRRFYDREKNHRRGSPPRGPTLPGSRPRDENSGG